ncbi:hypothetical protein Hdeb2414_s0004g00133221 [Helianthus debilis subsp. tardiflorus]
MYNLLRNRRNRKFVGVKLSPEIGVTATKFAGTSRVVPIVSVWVNTCIANSGCVVTFYGSCSCSTPLTQSNLFAIFCYVSSIVGENRNSPEKTAGVRRNSQVSSFAG